MTTHFESLYWKSNPEWYRWNDESGYSLTDKATDRARKSFDMYMAEVRKKMDDIDHYDDEGNE